MTEKRFENRLNKSNVKFNTLNPVWDNKKEDALNVFEMIECLNTLHEENTKVLSLIDKKIDDLQRKYDLGQKEGFCPMHNIMHSINTLKEIKKEMGWE